MSAEQDHKSTGFKGARSMKALESSKLYTQFQKQYYLESHDRATKGEAVIYSEVGSPVEVFHAMDLPVFFAPNFSAILSAKQMAAHYLEKLNDRGYHRNLCRYCTVPMGYFFENKPELAPWGGIPKPAAFVISGLDDPIIKIHQLLAKELQVPYYIWDQTMIKDPPTDPYWRSPEDMEAFHNREAWRLDYAVEETEGMITFLESVSGKTLSYAKLKETVNRAQEQYGYIEKAMDLAAQTPTTMPFGDHMAALIGTQFFRGHEFGLAQAKRLYEELKDRRDKGITPFPNEKIRLMYIYVPNWFTPGFYDYFYEKYGAVFSWLGYLPLIARNMMRTDLSDPMKVLASIYLDYGKPGMPPFWPEIHVEEAKRWQIDGVVYPIAESCKFLCGPARFTTQALEENGFPTMQIVTDMVDVRDWDDDKMKAQYSNFIEMLLELKEAG
jgi:benzoyl-CoA reductase subunit B